MAGAGYKLFNTGDVLTAAQVNTYLQEQAVMRFANAAARTTALSGVLAEGMVSYLDDTNSVEVYNGSAWVSVGGASSPLTTKGDLYTYSTTNARLAVGNNGETIVADSSTSTGLRWQGQYPAGKNFFINGAMQIWQRGTSVANSTTAFGPDRWRAYRNTTGATTSRQASGLTGFQYCARVQRDSGNTAVNGIDIEYNMATEDAVKLAGQTVTFSFYARSGANFSAASSAAYVQAFTGTGTDQNAYAGYTGSATVLNTTATLTTTWTRYSYQITIGSTATEFAALVGFTPVGTAGANDFFEITGLQLEIGSVATAFQTATGTLAGELAACLYYFNRLAGENNGQQISNGQCWSTTEAMATINYPIMRVAPTITYSTASFFSLQNATNTEVPITALASYNIRKTSYKPNMTVASGLVAGNATLFQTRSSGTIGTLDLSAEL